jgi:deazaflavin-dependent oxidoreductase (nitroreductase family)
MDKQEKRAFNERNIAEFRQSGGRIASFGDAPVLLLTTTGSRSGQRRTAPMMYLVDEADPDRVFVFASAAGADSNPAWFDNLAANPAGLEVELGEEKLAARATILPESERAAVFAEQARLYPGFAGYQEKTERRIPVVALDLQRRTGPLPDDDPSRDAVQVSADGEGAQHLAVVGDTYTVLVSGRDTAGRYTLIDMLVPRGGGPPPHRHDFEEMFTVLEGEIEVTFRGETKTVRAGETVNVPANAPHRFTNAAATPARLLCMCTPAGQEEFFALVGDLVPSRTSPPPSLSDVEREERMRRAIELAPRFHTELLIPDQPTAGADR